MGDSELLMGFVGDLFVDRLDPASLFRHAHGELDAFDYLFGNLEAVFTEDPHIAPSAYLPVWTAPSNWPAIADAGFDVLSLAHNHTADAGHKALLDTRHMVEARGIEPCGAGKDTEEAHRAAIVERNGWRIGCNAYASMFPVGYEARQNWPGLAPMRSNNIYDGATPNQWVPGELPSVRTVSLPDDISALRRDIVATAATADIVLASFHWGDWTRKFFVGDHERRVAREAIDAGADIVVGHHQHALRGIEWYSGKPIFYGLGHFVFDAQQAAIRAERLGLWQADPDSYGAHVPRVGWPTLPFHPDMRMTIIAFVRISSTGIDAGFVPCHLEPDGAVRPHDADSQEGSEVARYMREACSSQDFGATFQIAHNEVIGSCRPFRALST